jgi:hypothetical protein
VQVNRIVASPTQPTSIIRPDRSAGRASLPSALTGCFDDAPANHRHRPAQIPDPCTATVDVHVLIDQSRRGAERRLAQYARAFAWPVRWA